MKFFKTTTAAVLATLLALPALADDTTAKAFFDRLAGAWQGAGEVNRMSADMRMQWETVLDGQFRRLSMENRMTGKSGESLRFGAQAYYRIAKDGTISGMWFDSRGYSLPLSGRVDGDVLTVEWGTADIERGRSSYRLAGDALEVVDEVYAKDGALNVFGRTRLTRLR
ncbi:MAG: hypothetical protein ACRETY_03285 [Steroidobacteraceae bacterium]